MSERKKTSAIMTLALLSTLFYVATLTLAQYSRIYFLSPLALVVTAVPVVLACRIGGIRLCAPIIAGAAACIWGFWGLYSAVDYGVSALLGLAMGFFARRYSTRGEIFLSSLTVWIGAFLGRMVLEYQHWGINILSPTPEMVESIIRELEQLVGTQSADTIQIVSEQLVLLMPFALICMGLILTALVYRLSSFFLKRYDMALPAWSPLSTWRMPRSLLWAYLFSLLTLMSPSLTGKAGQMMASASVSMELLLRLLFMLQGIAVAIWWLQKKGVRPFLNYVLILLALAIPVVGQVATMVGIIDLWIDFRTRYGGESS